MTENDWFFNLFEPSVYDTVKSGKSVSWRALDEQGRYEIWSLHIESGGKELTFSEFCDIMDNPSKTFKE